VSRRLLTIEPYRQTKELQRAREVEEQARSWRRTWRRVFAECVALAMLGYAIYGASFATQSGEVSDLIVAISFCVSYALPFFRLVFFYVKHSDQF